METNTQKNDIDLLAIYDVLGELFSMNYSCLRISNQDMPIERMAGVFDSSDVFGSQNKLKSVWIESKLKDAAKTRNDTFSEIVSAWKQQNPFFFGDNNIVELVENSKTTLISLFNTCFGTNFKFEDIFDGFQIKHKEFAKIAHEFDTKAVFSTNSEAVSNLLNDYFYYVEILKTYMLTDAFDALVSTLQREVSEGGRPTIYYGKPQPPITTIHGSEIEPFINQSEQVLKDVKKQIKTENKKLVPLYKRTRKNFSDYDAHSEISKIKSVIFNLLEKQKKAELFNLYSKALLKRLAYANTDYDASKLTSFFEGVLDLTTGINIFKKDNKLKYESVYIHELEKSFLYYLSELFKDSNSLSASKTEENQKI